MKNNKDIQTIMVMAAGFIAVYLLWDLRWAIYTALVLTLIGSFSSRLSGMIAWLWMKLSWVLSLIIPKVLLGMVFFLILYPTSLISKLFGSKSNIVLKNDRDSFFVNTNKEFSPESFEKPW